MSGDVTRPASFCFLFFALASFILKQCWCLGAPGSWRGGKERVRGATEVLMLPLSSFTTLWEQLHLSALQFSHLCLPHGVVMRIDGAICNGLQNSISQHMINNSYYL